MGKVRDQFNEVEGLAQWVGRKVANHHPLSVRTQKIQENTRFDRKNKVKQDTGWQVGIDEADPTVVYYQLTDGRRFRLKVEQVDSSEEMPPLVAVGT